MKEILDLDRYPLDRPQTKAWQGLMHKCRDDLARDGMFNLHGFLKPGTAGRIADEIQPVMDQDSFTHRRSHNIYFERQIDGLDADHPALQEVETVNHTVCADQIPQSSVIKIYQWQPLVDFLAAVMQKPVLHLMADPIACANVISYRNGEALNWHFDRSEFTVTLLLQSPREGGVFEYRSGLRSNDDPNYDGVADLLRGNDSHVRQLDVEPGTLNVFKGKNTAHRVTPVIGKRNRMIAVLCYYERSGVTFSAEERLGFYGRTE